MQPIRVKTVQESDLRMLGNLARNIQRVLPVTQADIDAAAALGKGWVVWKVFEVPEPLDNMRGCTQLIIRQNSIQAGQNVRRVIFVVGPGGQTVVIRGSDYIVLPDAIADSLSYVKAFGGTEQRNLPDNYIERQFIYMMDGSYLLTDIVPTYDCKVEMDFQTTSLPAVSVAFLGGRNSVYPAGLQLSYASDTRIAIDGFGTRYTSTALFTANTQYKFVWDNQVATVYQNNTVVATNTFTNTDATGAALCINGMNNQGTVIGNIAGIYLYGFKVWNAQGVLVADYVPAVQKGTVPVVGFYDTVSKTFKTATAGTFAAGGEAVPTPDAPMDIVSNNGVLKARHQSGLPLGYTLLDYIESTGTQYIDTGVSGNLNTKLELVYQHRALNLEAPAGRLFGSRISPNDNAFVIGTSDGSTNPSATLYAQFDSVAPTIIGQASVDTDKHTIVLSKDGFYVDGSLKRSYSNPVAFETPETLLLFNIVHDMSIGAGQSKVYSVKLWNNDTLVRNMVPAKQGNTVGMYDTVSGQFLTNQGTGTFTAGNPVSDPVEIYADSKSKNLFNIATAIASTGITASTGEASPAPSIVSASDYIPVSGGENYTLNTQLWSTQTNGIAWYNANKEYISGQVYTGLAAQTFTAPANAYYARITVKTNQNPFQFEQGSTATAYKPYWDTTETILAYGKNLFNPATVTNNKYISANGNEITSSGEAHLNHTDFIKVKAGTSYTISVTNRDGVIYSNTGAFNWFSSRNLSTILATRNTYQISENLTDYTASFVAPTGAEYLIINFVDGSTVQVERGSTATAYQPYYDGGTATAEMLLKVGDYEDVQEILSGAITRNVGVKVFDGTETITFNTPGSTWSMFTYPLVCAGRKPAICTHGTGDVTYSNVTTLNVCAGTANRLFISMDWATFGVNAETPNPEKAAALLRFFADQYNAGTPVIVIYPLATPTTESVAGQTLQVTDGDNVLEITQASLNGLELEAEYQAAVSLTIQEVQDANLDPNVEVTIN